jgi:hypothetical protein
MARNRRSRLLGDERGQLTGQRRLPIGAPDNIRPHGGRTRCFLEADHRSQLQEALIVRRVGVLSEGRTGQCAVHVLERMIVEYVVHLATELCAEALRNLDVLVDIPIEVRETVQAVRISSEIAEVTQQRL